MKQPGNKQHLKIGIAADNYKLDKFKKELAAAGYNEITIKKFTEDTSTIFIRVKPNDIMQIKKICQKVELHFKKSN